MQDLKHIIILEIYQEGKILMLGQKLSLSKKFTWGRKDLMLNQKPYLFPSQTMLATIQLPSSNT